jgi:hypothetical protein
MPKGRINNYPSGETDGLLKNQEIDSLANIL